MPLLLRLISKMPLPTGTKLAWQRPLIDRAYAQDITAARKANDNERIRSLEFDRQFEIQMCDE